MPRLANKITLITGAGSGLGRAMAIRFAAEGAFVYVTDANAACADQTAETIAEAGGKTRALAMDVTLCDDVLSVFEQVKAGHGRLDCLVNNAGIMLHSDFRALSDEDWLRQRDVNVDGVVRIARDGFELLRASGLASLINVASIMGERGARQHAAYSATKGAVIALTRALAIEYAAFGIRVNAVSPGFIMTAINQKLFKFPPLANALIEKTAMKRLGTPEEVAAAALFLASDDASYVTGALLPVDGGLAASL